MVDSDDDRDAVVLGLIALAVVWGVRSFAGHRQEDGGGASPMDVLDRRLADGSISIEEYEQRRPVLLGPREEGTDYVARVPRT